MLEQGDADATGLHDQAGAAGHRDAGPEGGVQPRMRDGDAEAVRTYQPHAVPAADGEQVRASRAQARGDDDERVHAAPAALRRHRSHIGGREGDDREVDAGRKVFG